jgi:ATP-dependent exoDNAse (exonuclease V) beta subunit
VLSEHFTHEGDDRPAKHATLAVGTPGLRRLAPDWVVPAPAPSIVNQGPPAAESEADSEQSLEFEWARLAARHIGTLVHRMLCLVSLQGVDAWSGPRLHGRRAVWSASLRAMGVPDGELDAAVDRVETAMGTVLDDPRGRWLLDPTHKEARSEYALSGVVDGRLVSVILDRTFVDADGTRWIVDYKTGRHLGGDLDAFLDREQTRYRDQLERYACLMAQLDSAPIRLGLYFPLYAGWREWGCAGPKG